MTTHKLRELLAALRDAGVEEYSAGNVHVKFAARSEPARLEPERQVQIPSPLRMNPGFARLPDATRAILMAQMADPEDA